ncbi:MAG: hypothetical protein ACLQRH_14535 [Acidimicrobiales bacterium]
MEQYGVNTVTADVPGAVAPTADEKEAYACGDFTPAEVQAGATSPTCGTTNPNNSSQPGGAGASSGTAAAGTATATATKSATAATATKTATVAKGASINDAAGGTTGTSGGAGSSSSGVDPGVSLAGASTPLASTGVNPLPLVAAGLFLVSVGWLGRRRLLRTRMGGRIR